MEHTELFPRTRELVSAHYAQIAESALEPWRFFNSTPGELWSVKRFNGKPISYQGVSFEGSPRDAFWGGFIDPYLKHATKDVLDRTLATCQEHDLEPRRYVEEAAKHLRSLVASVLGEMIRIDQELRGRGFPKSVEPRDVTGLDNLLIRFVDEQLQVVTFLAEKRGLPMSNEATHNLVTATESTNPPRVFICHMQQDSDVAEDLFDRLKDAGADPWLDKRSLALGDDWEHEIQTAVGAADAFVVCLRPGFDEIGFRQKEVRFAIEALKLRPPGRGFVIPFIVQPCELPDWCRQFHAGSDLTKQTSFDDLVASIEKHCETMLQRSKSRPSSGSDAERADATPLVPDAELSPLAKTLIDHAVSNHGRLLVSEHLDGASYGPIKVSGKDHRAMVRHDAALRELTASGVLNRRVPASAKTDREALYEVTADGYLLHDKLRSPGVGE